MLICPGPLSQQSLEWGWAPARVAAGRQAEAASVCVRARTRCVSAHVCSAGARVRVCVCVCVCVWACVCARKLARATRRRRRRLRHRHAGTQTHAGTRGSYRPRVDVGTQSNSLEKRILHAVHDVAGNAEGARAPHAERRYTGSFVGAIRARSHHCSISV